MTMVPRWELRAAIDERVHDAVVSDVVCDVSTQVDRSAHLGRRVARGIRDTPASVRRHLGHHAGVSKFCLSSTYTVTQN